MSSATIFALLLRPLEPLHHVAHSAHTGISTLIARLISALISEIASEIVPQTLLSPHAPPSPPLLPAMLQALPPASPLEDLCWPPLGFAATRERPDDFVLLAAQHVLLLWLVTLLIMHSGKFAYRTLDGTEYEPRRNNSAWVASAAVVAALQLAFTVAGLGWRVSLRAFALTPWYIYLLALGALLAANVVDSLVKQHDRKGFERRNRRLYLEFTTKLGMHSPIEPGWKTPKSFLDEDES